MKKTILSTILIGIISLSSYATNNNDELQDKSYAIDTKISKVFWTGKKVTGQHTGGVLLKSGELKTIDGKLVAGSFEIDMSTIICSDLSDAETNKNLIGHLQSDDFFGTAKFQTAQFVITSVSPIEGATDRDNNYTITGKLTIKGITNEISFPAMVLLREKLVAQAEIKIDRTKFDIKYGSGSFFENLGDKTIADEISFNIVLSGI
jgi:polyisoprenoid-binding protein YceI